MINGLSHVLVAMMTATSAEPFEIRGWDIERFDPVYVVEMIHKAHKAGMNTISLSHEIVMNAEEIILDWHRYKHLQRFCEEAHGLGMRVYLWNHQINNPPPDLIAPAAEGGKRRLNLDAPHLWEWLDNRYERVVQRVPALDGIILSLTESEFQIPRDNEVVTAMNQAERMAKVINTVHAALSRHGKRLIVRDFLRTPGEMGSFRRALAMVPDDVWVYTKCVPNDWQYRYPPHALLGKVSPHKQIMELDLANEIAGGDMVMPAAGYYRDQLRMAREKGLAGAIGRCDDGFFSNVGTPAEFNVWSYSRLLHDPDADLEAMWKQWHGAFYGTQAAPTAVACLKECFDMVCAIRYTLGFWTGDHRASVAYADGHLIRNTTTLWSSDPKYARIERLLLDSGPETIAAVVAEKREARETALRCIQVLDSKKSDFEPAKFGQLREYFVNAARHAHAGELWVRTYFALRWYRNSRSPQAKTEAETALRACRDFTTDAAPDRQTADRLSEFADEVEAELARTAKTKAAP